MIYEIREIVTYAVKADSEEEAIDKYTSDDVVDCYIESVEPSDDDW